jgi:chemotaxis protein CheD
MKAKHPRSKVVSGAAHTLHPGGVVCADRGDRLETLLGSCVAVVLTDRARTVGAMCHIVHSQPAINIDAIPTASADAAIDAMYRLLMGRSLSPRLCCAFVYGGGNMFPTVFKNKHVGEDNGRYVLDRLAADGVCVVFQDLGGDSYRRLSWTIGHAMPEVTSVLV